MAVENSLLHVKNKTESPSDWVRCINCGREMLIPVGDDNCPYCNTGTLQFVLTDNPVELSDVLASGKYICYTFN